MADDKNPLSKLPLEKIMGHMSYSLSRMNDYCLGPMAQMNRKRIDSLEVGVRLSGSELEYNPEMLRDMGSLDGSTAIKAQLFHAALHHMSRKKVITGGQEKYYPYADLASQLSTYHKLATEQRKVSDKFYHPKDFGFPEDLSMEQYFKLLIEKDQQKGNSPDRFDPTQQMIDEMMQGQQQSQQGQGQGEGQGGEEGEEEGEGQGGGGGEKKEKPKPDQTKQLAKDLGCKDAKEKHRMDNSQWHKVSPGQEHRMAEKMVAELERSSRERGSLPAGLKRLINEIRETVKEKWYEKVAKLMGTKLATDTYRYSKKRPSKRYGFPYAGRQRNKTDPVFEAIDTSGSIGKNELQIFIEKTAGLCKRRQAELTIIVCDAEIHSITKVTRKHQLQALDLRGGGGTSSLPVFEYLKDKHVGMLVYLTDLYIDFPTDKPNFPVIWAVINRGEEEKLEVPFGEVFRLQVDKETF